MRKAKELWKILFDEKEEELKTLRQSLLTNKQIAEKIIPYIYSKYPGVAEVAISYALWLVLWNKGRNIQTRKVISELWKRPDNIKRLKEISKDWMKARLEKYWEEEVFQQQSEWWKKAAELQWKKVFSDEEKAFVISLCNNPKYRNKFWKLKREEVAKEVNNKFREWEPIRNGTAVADCFRRYK